MVSKQIVSQIYTLLGKKAEIPTSVDLENYLTERTTTQVLENNTTIHINKGSDIN